MLADEVQSARKAEVAHIGELLDKHNFVQAGAAVRKLMFLEKFAAEISHIIEHMEE